MTPPLPEIDTAEPTTTDRPVRAMQLVNTLARSDGGPARNSFEVNLALNALPDLVVQMFWMEGDLADSVVAVDSRPAPRVAPLRGGVLRALRTLRSADVVIIHGFYLAWVPLVTAACRLRGIPFVIMPHGVFTDFQRESSQSRKRVFDALCGRRIRRRAATFLVATNGEADELRNFDPAVSVTVSGVGTNPAARTATGAPHSPLRLVSMSRLASKKRVDVAVEAVAELRERGIDATLQVAGTGEPQLEQSLRSLVSSAALDDRVSFVGEVAGERKTDFLADADIFLAPSEDENFGIAVAEALAHGLPVVATRKVNAAAVADGVAGALTDGPSAVQTADRIEELLRVPDFSAMHDRAVGVAREHYEWSAVALKWRDALRTSITGQRGRTRLSR